jgi:hypothetical protein
LVSISFVLFLIFLKQQDIPGLPFPLMVVPVSEEQRLETNI